VGFLLVYFLGWKYESAIDTTVIWSRSHFEGAIAVAVTLYGIRSGAALATVMCYAGRLSSSGCGQ
jgi:ACR3 family arsenite efflux pump ArsB